MPTGKGSLNDLLNYNFTREELDEFNNGELIRLHKEQQKIFNQMLPRQVVEKVKKGRRTVRKIKRYMKKHFAAIMAHRRYGKDFFAFIYCVAFCASMSGANVYYFAPTYAQIKGIIKEGSLPGGKKLTELIPKPLLKPLPLRGIVNESDLSVTFINDSKIFLKNAQNADVQVGLTAHGAVFTEGAMISREFYDRIYPSIQKNIEETGLGFILLISTPRGLMNWFTQEFLKKINKEATPKKVRDKWILKIIKASESLRADGKRVLSDSALEDARIEMGNPDVYEEEYECALRTTSEGSWYRKQLRAAREEGRITNLGRWVKDRYGHLTYKWNYFRGNTLFIGCDLGVNDRTVLWFFQVYTHPTTNEKRMRYLWHYRNSDEGAEHYAQIIEEKIKDMDVPRVKVILPHDGEVREWSTHTKRSDMLQQAFKDQRVTVVTLDTSELAQNDMRAVLTQINQVRKNFELCEFDSNECYLGVEKLGQYTKKFNKATNSYIDTPDHNAFDKASDDADAFRTCVIYFVLYLKNKSSQVINKKVKMFEGGRTGMTGGEKWN